MSVQGHLLDITVIGCRNLKDTEWISRQDPYVILEYAGNRYRTKTHTDGGRNPTFNEKYMLPLIEGLRDVNVSVYNSNTLSADDFIGSGKILLQTVLSDGYHDSTWPLTSRSGRRAGEVRVIMHYKSPKGKQNVVPCSSAHHQPVYAAPPMYPPSQPSGNAGYPPIYTPYPPAGQSPYGPYGAGYPPSSSYGVQPPHGTYPPQVHPPQAYPPQVYPPQGYGYGAPPSGAYPPYQGGSWTR